MIYGYGDDGDDGDGEEEGSINGSRGGCEDVKGMKKEIFFMCTASKGELSLTEQVGKGGEISIGFPRQRQSFFTRGSMSTESGD